MDAVPCLSHELGNIETMEQPPGLSNEALKKQGYRRTLRQT